MSRYPLIVPGGFAVKGQDSLTGKLKFSLVYDGGKSWAGKEIIIRALPNGLSSSRFGFAVSRRVGKAVVRNHVKRLLREIIRQTPVRPGWDIIFIARIPAVIADFNALSKSVRNLLCRAGLFLGDNESIGPGTN